MCTPPKELWLPCALLHNATSCLRALFYIWLQSYTLASCSSVPKVFKRQTNPPMHSVDRMYNATGDEMIQIHAYACKGTVATSSPASFVKGKAETVGTWQNTPVLPLAPGRCPFPARKADIGICHSTGRLDQGWSKR